jgi:glutathione S-transferase
MLKFWGRVTSINVRKVLMAVQELGIAFERTDAGMAFGIVQTPDYRAKNPNALVPMVEDGDFVLWESNVVVRYLCAKHALGTLYPEDLRARFDAERWMDWQQTTFNPAGRDAFMQLIRTPAEQRKPELIEKSRVATHALLDLLDAHLAQRAYIGGAQFTMADIPLACEMHRWRGLPLPHPPRAHVDRWYQSILARPSSRGVLDLPLS